MASFQTCQNMQRAALSTIHYGERVAACTGKLSEHRSTLYSHVCVYVYIYIYMHMYIYIYMYTHTCNTYIYIYTHIHIHDALPRQ